ncbi:hypothetical protein [Epilithonimonas lactis]|uniref:TonB-like protein n=1 Tax=Epilithonimonas lactis TaxID=421072 RepID=A0A085BMQ0_9FLAO|nr:hypothetical protein [Epilithonimonas lactis]KFC23745.1 hypothetical protein IO89_04025 [Epilithonimonas lactis]SEQ23738.1 hypothetical protein SAMN04488097_1775 [Epilithonimonas lactis]
MRSLLLSLSLIIGSFAFAQNNDVEDMMNIDIPMNDSSLSSVAYNVRGIYQLKDNACDPANFKSLRYPGGADAYIKEIKEKLAQNVNWKTYVINGLFFVKMDITKDGVLSKLEAGPKVTNSEPFLNDLKEAAKKVNKTWTPAKCSGNPIDSQAMLKIDFSSMAYDSSFN